MNQITHRFVGRLTGLAVATVMLVAGTGAGSAVVGVDGPAFNLAAKSFRIATPDGHSVLMWGYANGAGAVGQYPGPTLIVDQGDVVTVTLTNNLPVPVSMVFPGQVGVAATGGAPGVLTREAPTPLGAVTYTFTASQPGTFLYHSGTRPELQVEMGLFGALIVRPAGFNPANPTAYGDASSAYKREHLFVLSEIDPRIHDAVANGLPIDTTSYDSEYWFINGRPGPDTVDGDGVPHLPNQPYSALARAHPGDKLLMRVVGAGRQMHPFHHHGNHATVIARDGALLESAPGAGADLGVADFTIPVVAGGTYDAIFQWTGEKIGWDVYGHEPGDPMEPGEYAPDHGKKLLKDGAGGKIVLPNNLDMTFGGFYSGTPFLGKGGNLPPGEGGMNPSSGFVYMWHSHTERELVNFDVFPGGMMTMFILEHPATPID